MGVAARPASVVTRVVVVAVATMLAFLAIPSLAGASTPGTDPPGVPSPTGITLTPGANSIAVTWSTPNDPADTVEAWTSDGTSSCSATADQLGCTIDDLSGSATYDVQVQVTDASATTSAAVDAGNATTPADAPLAPLDGVTLTPEADAIAVSWTAPTDPTISIQAQTSDGTSSCSATADQLGCTIEGLSGSTTYDVQVQATSSDGTQSETVDAGDATTPVEQPPSTPTDLTATPQDGAIAVGWDAIGDWGVTVSATATSESDPSDSQSCTTSGQDVGGPVTGCLISDLTDGSTYDIVVTATNGAGSSEPASLDGVAIPMPSGGPSAPGSPQSIWLSTLIDGWDGTTTTPIATPPIIVEGPVVEPLVAPADQGASTPSDLSAPVEGLAVHWQAPSDDGGLPIASYSVAITGTDGAIDGTCTAAAPATSCDVEGLTPGSTYVASVSATNAVGTSAAATSVDDYLPSIPIGSTISDPIVTPDPSGTGFDVSWSEPSDEDVARFPLFVALDGQGDFCEAAAQGPGATTSCVLETPGNQAPSSVEVITPGDLYPCSAMAVQCFPPVTETSGSGSPPSNQDGASPQASPSTRGSIRSTSPTRPSALGRRTSALLAISAAPTAPTPMTSTPERSAVDAYGARASTHRELATARSIPQSQAGTVLLVGIGAIALAMAAGLLLLRRSRRPQSA